MTVVLSIKVSSGTEFGLLSDSCWVDFICREEGYNFYKYTEKRHT